MTKKDILNEVANSKWQPEFEFTDSINDVVDSILKPHEDYGLGLYSELIKILEEARELSDDGQDLLINIGWILDVQKRLYNYKLSLLTEEWYWLPNTNLHNETGGLGLRNRAVQVGNWLPPSHYLIPILLDMCLPIMINWDCSMTLAMDYHAQTSLSEIASFNSTDTVKYFFKGGYSWDKELDDKYEADILKGLTQWYKVFETIHPLNDLNGRVGGLIINIVSHNLTGKYLINKEYYK
jgi:hypothetical protein